jgi:ABC-type multidrug transport system fused ATPase/permease subunit
MSVSYAIFEAEFKSSIRRNVESVKKRFAATSVIILLGMIFSFACIRLVKFVIDNPELFPEGSNEGYGTILVIFFALFTLRSAGTTYRKVIKSKIMDIHLVQPIFARQIMSGMLLSIVVPNLLLAGPDVYP